MDEVTPPQGHPYLAFTIDTDQEVARDRFVDKYGTDPQYIFTSGNLLLVGPVPKGAR